jgi:hypothetical protein
MFVVCPWVLIERILFFFLTFPAIGQEIGCKDVT